MKNIFLFLATFYSFQAFTQTSRSIEVKVKDTVELKVISADVLLTIENDYSFENLDYNYDYEEYDQSEYDYDYEADYYAHQTKKEKRQEKRNNKKFEKEMKKMEKEMSRYEASIPPMVEEIVEIAYDSTEIDYPIEAYESYYMTFEERKSKWISFLTTNAIAFDTTESKDDEDYSIYSPFKIHLNTLSMEKLDLVFQFADSVENTYPSISKVNYESIEAKMDSAYASLYKKAQTEANSLAKVLGTTPSKVIRVYEPMIDISNFGEAYTEMINSIMKKSEDNLKPENKKAFVERIFVFEIK